MEYSAQPYKSIKQRTFYLANICIYHKCVYVYRVVQKSGTSHSCSVTHVCPTFRSQPVFV